MIPLRDANPGLARPIVTYTIIVVTAIVWLFVQVPSPDGDAQVFSLATIPCEIVTGDPLDIVEINTNSCLVEQTSEPFNENKSVGFSLIASLFLHASFAHLLGNLWSLLIFGNNVEDAFGRFGFLAFYLIAGIGGSLVHVVLNQSSVTPLIGASGAIAGVMGAYLLLFPHARITTLMVYVPVKVPAWIFLLFWFGYQFIIAAQASSVAWDAHVGGFVIGAGIVALMRPLLLRRLRAHHFPFDVAFRN